MGFTSVKAQLMSVPPYVFGSIVCIVGTKISDRIRSRGIVLLVLGPMIIVGFALLRQVNVVGVMYFGIFLATGGAFTSSPLWITWSVDNSAGPMVRAISSGFAVATGSMGGLVATWTYLPTDAPRYLTGHSINLAMAATLLCMAVGTTTYCRIENKKRDRGERDSILEGLNEEEQNKLGHFHPAFRYTP